MPNKPVGPPVAAGTSVLVVDDNEDAAVLLADVLEMLGCCTRVAHDGPAVLEIALAYVPDIALVDIGLPAMDGYELTRRLRALQPWRGVRMIAVTGYGQEDDRKRSQEAGFDQHLIKPLDLATIRRQLAAS